MAEKKRRKRRRRLLNRKVELALHIGLMCALAVAAVVLIARAALRPSRTTGTYAAGISAAGAQAAAQGTDSVEALRDADGTAVQAVAQNADGAAIQEAPQGTDSAEPIQDTGGAAAQTAAQNTNSVISGAEEAVDSTGENSPPSEVAKIRQVGEEEIQITDLSGDWRLVLVNPANRLPSDYEADTCKIFEDEVEQIDWRIYDDLHAMLRACENADHSPIIRAAYRTQAQQEELFEQKVDQFMAEGRSEEEARQDAATVVALPGTSEHQLGLAVDIVSGDDTKLSEAQENTATQQWLMEHSWEYGFVLRYPTDKSGITGIIYEPWHYRYVGKEAAKTMYEQNLCLEEYLYAYRSGGGEDDG